MTSDEPRLDLVAGADPAVGAADVAQAADRGEPVGVLDVGDHREGFLGWHWEGDVGARFDHG